MGTSHREGERELGYGTEIETDGEIKKEAEIKREARGGTEARFQTGLCCSAGNERAALRLQKGFSHLLKG